MNKNPISFKDFGFSDKIIKGIESAGFLVPSPIQQEVIPFIFQGRDIIAQAHTGTGKTAAFGLPLMDMLNDEGQMLVITPTRELAMQVSDELYRLGKEKNIITAVICGGQSYSRQKTLIDSGVQVIAATPGRLLDLYSTNKLTSFKPKFVVLDEADEMLDMGFLDDIKKIFEFLPKNRQTLLFSATIPTMVEKLAVTILNNPVRISTKTAEKATNIDINELYFLIEEHERDDATIRLIDYYDPLKAIVFTRTKKDADRLSNALLARGYLAKCLHGDLAQPQREEVIKSFRKGVINLLIATDVAARGLDISDVSHVLNYHIPFDPESYVHRVGRTGRAGKKGMAITLVTPQEYRGLKRIQKVTGSDISYKRVPTLKEAQNTLIKTLIEKVRNAKHSPLSISFAEILQENMDLKDAVISLASLVTSTQGVGGPENLGLDEKRMKNINSKFQEQRNTRKRPYAPRGDDRHGSSRFNKPYNKNKSFSKKTDKNK